MARSCEHGNETSDFEAKRLVASQDALNSMELIICSLHTFTHNGFFGFNCQLKYPENKSRE
jgi:hypothetical protein